ncbi:MAG: ribbon-helix-helix protein, CopG family [Clostridia bacterium]|nr:ribbon-helix-helix protein, CopG family [Clostridia bacterium]
MTEQKLIITPKRYTEESQVISVRMPKDMLHDVDKVAQDTGRTRNEIILLGLEFALRHMEITEK